MIFKKNIAYKTPLHIAFEKNEQDIIQLLLERNDIDKNAKDEISKYFLFYQILFYGI